VAFRDQRTANTEVHTEHRCHQTVAAMFGCVRLLVQMPRRDECESNQGPKFNGLRNLMSRWFRIKLVSPCRTTDFAS
jgi:hypothetical protein